MYTDYCFVCRVGIIIGRWGLVRIGCWLARESGEVAHLRPRRFSDFAERTTLDVVANLYCRSTLTHVPLRHEVADLTGPPRQSR